MLKNHQDFAFFVDSFKFELSENLKRHDVRNLSFILSEHRFVLDLCNAMLSLLSRDSLLRNIALRSLLHNLALQIFP